MFPDLMRDDVFRLETERLWLRWPRASDAVHIAEHASVRAVAENTARIPYPYPPGAAAEFVLMSRAGNLTGAQIVLVLTTKQRPNEPLGALGLHQTAQHEALLGYWLGQPFWGNGLMTEAVCGLLGVAVSTTSLGLVKAWVRTGNAASRRVLEKIGFASDGFGVEPAPARGGSVPVERFLLTRAAWNGCEAGAARDLELSRAN